MDIEKEAREIEERVMHRLKMSGPDSMLGDILKEFFGENHRALSRAFSAGEEPARKHLVGHSRALPPEITGDGKKVADAIEAFRFDFNFDDLPRSLPAGVDK
jgi:hypothetical protein